MAQGCGKMPLRVLEDPLGIAGINVMTFEYIESGSPFKGSIPLTKTLAKGCVGMDGEPPFPKAHPYTVRRKSGARDKDELFPRFTLRLRTAR